jgi:ABC-type multidrug transport system ATPase subunit
LFRASTSTCREGEILALLGRNGAGKTSTLRTIARMDNPNLTHGEIWLDHKPLHTMKSYRGGKQRASAWCRKTGGSSRA